jgi:hypothetical protein
MIIKYPFTSDSQRTLADIAKAWSKVASEPPEAMMDALVRSFWRGDFERDGRSQIFALLQPPSVERPAPSELGRSSRFAGDRLPGDYATRADGHIVKVGLDLESYITADRYVHEIVRGNVAKVLGGVPEYFPCAWDGSVEGLLGFATTPWEKWPDLMRSERYSQWWIRREHFAAWYESSPLSSWAPLESFWPVPRNSLSADAVGPSPFVARQVADGGSSPRRRGRQPVVFARVRKAMEENLDSGKYTVDQLDKLTEKVLAHEYDASRETVRKARNAVLQQRGGK